MVQDRAVVTMERLQEVVCSVSNRTLEGQSRIQKGLTAVI